MKGEFIAPDTNNFSFKGKPKNIPLNCKTELDFLELFLNKLLIERILKDSKRKQQKRKEEQRLKNANGNIKDDTLFDFNLNSNMIKRKIIADLSISLNAHPSLNLQFLNNSDLYGNNYLKRIDIKSKRILADEWRDFV